MTLPNRSGYSTSAARPASSSSTSSSTTATQQQPSASSASSMLPLHHLQQPSGGMFGRQQQPPLHGSVGGLQSLPPVYVPGRTSSAVLEPISPASSPAGGNLLPHLYASSVSPSSTSALGQSQLPLSLHQMHMPSMSMAGQGSSAAHTQPQQQLLPPHSLMMMYPSLGAMDDQRLGMGGSSSMMNPYSGIPTSSMGGSMGPISTTTTNGTILPPLHPQLSHPSSYLLGGMMMPSATTMMQAQQPVQLNQHQPQHGGVVAPSSPISTSAAGTITIAPSLSPSVIDSSIEQLFPLSGRASTSVSKEALTHHHTAMPGEISGGTIIDTELASIFNNVEMMDSQSSDEVKIKIEPNPLHPVMLMVASTVGGKNLPTEEDWAAHQQQSILNMAAIVPSPPSPSSPAPSSSPHDSPALGGAGTSRGSSGSMLNDWTLDNFCKSQGINLHSPQKTAKGEEFIEKVKKLQEAYEVELNQLNLVADKYAAQLMTLLKAQSSTRAVTEREQAMKLAVVQERFNYLRTQLRQSVCNAIVLLQKHYNQAKKKRRSLSKKATEVLNNWFFNHLNDPYPSDEEKMMLASLCGLTLNQVNNWFGNKRIRYKRKCLEEEAKRGKILQQEMQEMAAQQDAGAGLYQYEPIAGPAGVDLDSGTSQYYI